MQSLFVAIWLVLPLFHGMQAASTSHPIHLIIKELMGRLDRVTCPSSTTFDLPSKDSLNLADLDCFRQQVNKTMKENCTNTKQEAQYIEHLLKEISARATAKDNFTANCETEEGNTYETFKQNLKTMLQMANSKLE